jgi:UDP-3-O-[3-hydroxymyristoyl] glucosamine N-acyltransferase
MKEFSIEDLKKCLHGLNATFVGSAEGKTFANLRSLREADEMSLVWASPLRKESQQQVEQTRARIMICAPSIEINESMAKEKLFIVVDNPKLAFVRVANALFYERPEYGIHPTAVIHPEAEIHPEVAIGPHCHVGKCSIGRGTILASLIRIHDRVQIGQDVYIHSGAIIGSFGFNYASDGNGEHLRFPHLGGVVVEDSAEIGVNTCIIAGVLEKTIICEGAKLADLVHIGANVRVGRNSHIRAGAVVLGSTVIKGGAAVAPSSTVRDYTHVGERAILGMGSVVVKDVPPNAVIVGNPGRVLRERET